MNPAIVINAYNRPDSLRRLLTSLQQAAIPNEVNIIFSLEFGAHVDVVQQVDDFLWKYGEKIIIRKQEKQGLIGHFIACGDLTTQYGTIIYLEDDLFVGTDFYKYTKAVLQQYQDENRIAGFSFNALWFNGYQHLPFKPVDDGGACFFLQVPWYQGQVYTAVQWAHFRNWYNNYKGVDSSLQMHPLFKNYQLTDDWFPIKTQYLVESGKYYCFPRVSQCINFGDAGTHFQSKTNFFQTELALRFDNTSFKSFDESLAVYDSFFELLPAKMKILTPHLKHYNFECDLNGMKDASIVQAEYIITSQKPASYIKSYALEMRPQELNIIYDIAGEHFYLAKTGELKNTKPDKQLYYKQFFYHNRFKLTRWQKLDVFIKS